MRFSALLVLFFLTSAFVASHAANASWSALNHSHAKDDQRESLSGLPIEEPPQEASDRPVRFGDDSRESLADSPTEAVGACPQCDEEMKRDFVTPSRAPIPSAKPTLKPAPKEKLVVEKKPKAAKAPAPAPKQKTTAKRPAKAKAAADPEEIARPDTSREKVSYLDQVMAVLKKRRGQWAEQGWCYRGVKAILMKAKVPGANKLSGGRAYYAMESLKAAGFRNGYPGSCNTPGVIRVYRGYAQDNKSNARRIIKKRFNDKATAGDYSGHIEILGSDGRYYYSSSKGSDTPINAPDHFGPERRILEGCFVK